MAVTKPRNRILIFRLTQDEYDQLQQASSGSRSLSEFARAKLMGSLGATPVDAQLNALSMRVQELATLIEKN